MNLLRLLSVFFKWLSDARPAPEVGSFSPSPAVLAPMLETLLRSVLALLSPARFSIALDWTRVNPLVFVAGIRVHTNTHVLTVVQYYQ